MYKKEKPTFSRARSGRTTLVIWTPCQRCMALDPPGQKIEQCQKQFCVQREVAQTARAQERQERIDRETMQIQLGTDPEGSENRPSKPYTYLRRRLALGSFRLAQSTWVPPHYGCWDGPLHFYVIHVHALQGVVAKLLCWHICNRPNVSSLQGQKE
ncbi:hypothetical protein K488DRAFT_71105 [Vararia minispora EC-137]|uniref:Uncharacterized protein n=1 Tax=Vararia minispora EC-137 TaxID=1314806 RepID=A0ACB8QJ18_9AGAM|nr:hypothetical protein K488DRAFT_71105 [Vararia minispora EC-137]